MKERDVAAFKGHHMAKRENEAASKTIPQIKQFAHYILQGLDIAGERNRFYSRVTYRHKEDACNCSESLRSY